MKMLLRGLLIASTCVVAEISMSQEAAKESYSVVKITKMDKSVAFQVLTRTELTEMQKKVKYESMVMAQAYKAVSAEWSKPGPDGKKGPAFPLQGMPPARSLKVLSQFTDSEKADKFLDKETKKHEDSQKKVEVAAAEKKKKQPESKKTKAGEKEDEQAEALAKLTTKVEELAWAKETEQSAAVGGAKEKGKE